MILTTIALIPYGIGSPERLGYIKISNQANHPKQPRMGNYKAEFYTKSGKLRRTVFVKDFARKSKDAFDLLHLVMIEYKKVQKQERLEKIRKEKD